MSTYSELELRCKRRLGRQGMTITTEFLDEMQAAQEELEDGPTLPNWLRTDDGGQTLIAGSVLPTVPSDFIRIWDDQGVEYTDPVDGKLKQMRRLDTRQQLESKRVAGIPAGTIYYWLGWVNGSRIMSIAPAQTVDITMTIYYFKHETVLTGSNENDWLVHDPNLMLGIAGAQIAIWLRDDRALQYYQGLEKKSRRQMVVRNESEDFGDTDLVMGDPD